MEKFRAHELFQCHTGMAIVKHLSNKLRGTNKIVCICNGAASAYSITIIDGARVTKPPFDNRGIVFCNDNVFALFVVDDLEPDLAKTNFPRFSHVFDSNFDLLCAGVRACIVDSENHSLKPPRVTIIAIAQVDINIERLLENKSV
jgi:hypothetical protein